MAACAFSESGIINTVAGNGTGSYTGDHGLAKNATLNAPNGIAVDTGITPGEIVTLFGTNLTTSTGINEPSGLPLPGAFQNVSVTVNGTPSRVLRRG